MSLNHDILNLPITQVDLIVIRAGVIPVRLSELPTYKGHTKAEIATALRWCKSGADIPIRIRITAEGKLEVLDGAKRICAYRLMQREVIDAYVTHEERVVRRVDDAASSKHAAKAGE